MPSCYTSFLPLVPIYVKWWTRSSPFPHYSVQKVRQCELQMVLRFVESETCQEYSKMTETFASYVRASDMEQHTARCLLLPKGEGIDGSCS